MMPCRGEPFATEREREADPLAAEVTIGFYCLSVQEELLVRLLPLSGHGPDHGRLEELRRSTRTMQATRTSAAARVEGSRLCSRIRRH